MAGNDYPHNEYERERNPTYWLVVFDTPKKLAVKSGDGLDFLTGEASLIWLSSAERLENHAGQEITFSIDPETAWWPSDVSLPANEPRTNDVHVLEG